MEGGAEGDGGAASDIVATGVTEHNPSDALSTQVRGTAGVVYM